MWKIWLVISGICFIMEICTVGFLIFWFAIGALVAMLASLLIDSVVVQTAIFVIASAILLFTTRPFVNKFAKVESNVKTNAHSIEGKKGKVITEIDPVEGTGQIKVDGEVWSAKSRNNICISKDSEVIVEKIDGVKAIVEKI